MRKVIGLLALLCCTAPGAMAGPNSGGVIWVHDTGIVFTTDLVLPPVSVKPADCAGVDNQQDADGVERVWKVYAAFPPGSSPRLKTVGWGIQFPDAGTSASSYVNVGGGGLPNEGGAGTDFDIETDGFPTTSGGMIGQSFPTGPRRTTVVTLYWFYGFGYNTSGPLPTWSLVQHTFEGNRIFGDDAIPPNEDPITAYGSLGFGQAGTTPCPTSDPDAACCNLDGSCVLTRQAACMAPSIWHGNWYACTPNPCPQPTGACCYADGHCQLVLAWECSMGGGVYQGDFVPCNPNPCPVTAACCMPSGSCLIRIQSVCLTLYPPGIWHPEWTSCDPNPCPQPPTGACCAPAGTCAVTTETACLLPRIWYAEWVSCTPNPCPQPPPEGACCNIATGVCTITTLAECPFMWIGAGTACNVMTCPLGTFELNAPLSAYPGELIDVAVMGSNSTPIAGYSINFTFDSAVFEFVGSTLAGTRGEGAADFIPGHTASAALAGVIYDFSCDPGILAGSGSMLIVTLRVKPDASVGGTDLVLQDQSPSLNRMSPCGGGTIVPGLSGRTIMVLALVTGACCDHATGDCTVTTQAACPFSWLGQDVACNVETCAISPTPTGSCCYSDGVCAVTTQVNCTAIWLPGGVCVPNLCVQPPAQGACCNRVTGNCTITSQAACGFDWLGAGVPCDLTTCAPPIPVERMSWGQIKSRYRQ